MREYELPLKFNRHSRFSYWLFAYLHICILTQHHVSSTRERDTARPHSPSPMFSCTSGCPDESSWFVTEKYVVVSIAAIENHPSRSFQVPTRLPLRSKDMTMLVAADCVPPVQRTSLFSPLQVTDQTPVRSGSASGCSRRRTGG